MDSEEKPGSPGGVDGKFDAEGWVPLSVREARRARKMRDDLWPYVWMNFVSSMLLAAALGIMAYRMGAQSCHRNSESWASSIKSPDALSFATRKR
jgi:hypothetical protein